MVAKRNKPEEIVTRLYLVRVLSASELRLDTIREVRITKQICFSLCHHYGGIETNQLKEIKRFQKENGRLGGAMSYLTQDKLNITEAEWGNL